MFGRYLLANKNSALPIAVLCALLSFFYLPGLFFAAIIVALFTLELGYYAGGRILFCILLPFVGLMLWQHISIFYILFFVSRYVLGWLLAGLYARYISWRLLLELLMVVGLVVVIAIHFFINGDLAQFWRLFIDKHLADYSNFLSDSITADQVKQQLHGLAGMATGFACAITFGDSCLQVLLARYWQNKIHQRHTLRAELISIRMGLIFAGLLTLLIIAKLLGSVVATDCLPVVLFPFVLSGLSLLHYLSYKYKKIKWVLIFIYLGLVFGQPVIIFALAILAYLDSGLDLRSYVRLASNKT